MWILIVFRFEEEVPVVVAVELLDVLGTEPVEVSDKPHGEILLHRRLDYFSWIHSHVCATICSTDSRDLETVPSLCAAFAFSDTQKLAFLRNFDSRARYKPVP